MDEGFLHVTRLLQVSQIPTLEIYSTHVRYWYIYIYSTWL